MVRHADDSRAVMDPSDAVVLRLCNRFSKFFVQQLGRVAEEIRPRLADSAELRRAHSIDSSASSEIVIT